MIEYRGYTINKTKDIRFYSIKSGKGKLPNYLSGVFTSVTEAKTLIDSYLGEEDAQAVK